MSEFVATLESFFSLSSPPLIYRPSYYMKVYNLFNEISLDKLSLVCRAWYVADSVETPCLWFGRTFIIPQSVTVCIGVTYISLEWMGEQYRPRRVMRVDYIENSAHNIDLLKEWQQLQ